MGDTFDLIIVPMGTETTEIVIGYAGDGILGLDARVQRHLAGDIYSSSKESVPIQEWASDFRLFLKVRETIYSLPPEMRSTYSPLVPD